MNLVLKTPAQVISALGGSGATAERLGIKQPRVSNWLGKRKRIPADLYLAVNAVLATQGRVAAPEVFGMTPLRNGSRRKSRTLNR